MREPTEDDRARLLAVQRGLQGIVMLAPDRANLDVHKAAFADEQLHAADRRALLAITAERLGIYRRLVRSTLLDSIRAELPLAAARLGDRFTHDVNSFCSDELPRSPILRDVAFEFVHWATPRWADDASLAPWLGDLARFELLEFDAHCGQSTCGIEVLPELAPDRRIVFHGTCRIGHFEFAVHELPDKVDDRSIPRPVRHGMFLFRDSENQVQRTFLTPVAAAILGELLVVGRPLGEAVRSGCAMEGRTLDATAIEGISVILEDLQNRGALLGSTAETPPLPPLRWRVLVARTAPRHQI